MTNGQTREILELTDPATALEFHLTVRHYPPIHRDFFPAVRRAVDLANDGAWDGTILLPNGRLLTVASIVEQLHLEPFLRQDDPWALEPESVTRTLCAGCSDTGANEEGEVTHCELCGVKVWE